MRSKLYAVLTLCFLSSAKAMMQIITDSSEPAAVASPIGKSVSGKSFEVRYTPGMRTSAIAEMLWMNDISDRPQAQKYPLKQKCIPAKSASQM